jgi:phosphoribosylaminoimidazole-succinocarboxamide synthase
MEKLLYSGSVKDIFQTEDPDHLEFQFSNRYSVFDWGEMPDQLHNKGAALAQMGVLFFQHFSNGDMWKDLKCPDGVDKSWFADLLQSRAYQNLCAKGLSHHFISCNSQRLNIFRVEKIDVHSPRWTGERYDYWKYQGKPTGALVPLEVIFRFGVPEGSSLLKRVGRSDYLKAIGLDQAPSAKDWLRRPIIEFSTKLENEDRYLHPDEAKEMAALSSQEFQDLQDIALLLACALKNMMDELELELWDGKFEFAFDGTHQFPQRRFKLVDSIGIDELRLLKDGIHLSKEYLRRQYRGSEWLQAVEKAKAYAEERQAIEWKPFCTMNPPLLNPEVKQVAEAMYMTLANMISQKIQRKNIFELRAEPQQVFQDLKRWTQ